MIDTRLAGGLDDCLDAVRRGTPASVCLRRYPSLRPELDSLLALALHLAAQPSVAFHATAKSATRDHLMDAIGREPRPEVVGSTRRRLPWRFVLAPAVGLAIAAALIFIVFAQLQGPDRSETATILTILQGDVQAETANGIKPGYNGMRLRPGDRVITSAGARAVLTFFEGSTVTLEGDTVVVLRSVAEKDGQLSVLLDQPQGSTWTHVPTALGPADVEIDTPSARLQIREASAETTVSDGGQTQVGAQSGAVEVQGSAESAEVPSGFRASVEPSGAVAAPVPAEKPSRELVLRVQGPAHAFLTDPRGATVGLISPGVPVNQLAGASLERDADAFVIRLPNPVNGSYRLGLTPTGGGTVQLSGAIHNGSSDRFDTKLDVRAGLDWSVSFSLDGDQLTLLNQSQQVMAVPSHVVVPPAAVEKANAPATETPKPSTSTPTPAPTSTLEPTRTATPRPVLTPKPIEKENTSPIDAVPQQDQVR